MHPKVWLSSLAQYLSLNGQNGWANGLNGLNGVGKGTWVVALSLHLLHAHVSPVSTSSSTSSYNNLRKAVKVILYCNLYYKMIFYQLSNFISIISTPDPRPVSTSSSTSLSKVGLRILSRKEDKLILINCQISYQLFLLTNTLSQVIINIFFSNKDQTQTMYLLNFFSKVKNMKWYCITNCL